MAKHRSGFSRRTREFKPIDFAMKGKVYRAQQGSKEKTFDLYKLSSKGQQTKVQDQEVVDKAKRYLQSRRRRLIETWKAFFLVVRSTWREVWSIFRSLLGTFIQASAQSFAIVFGRSKL